MGRILWRLTTPHALRRRTLAVLVAWLAVAVAHQNGMLGGEDPSTSQLPADVSSAAALR